MTAGVNFELARDAEATQPCNRISGPRSLHEDLLDSLTFCPPILVRPRPPH